jgi:hypothetical protein
MMVEWIVKGWIVMVRKVMDWIVMNWTVVCLIL